MEQKPSTQLEVPVYVTLRAEIISGLALKDFGKSMLVTLGTGLLLLLLQPLFHWNAFVNILILVVSFLFGTAYYTRMGETHLSIRDYIAITLKYFREQKRYPYLFGKGDKR